MVASRSSLFPDETGDRQIAVRVHVPDNDAIQRYAAIVTDNAPTAIAIGKPVSTPDLRQRSISGE